jgi:hypothetical protein
MVYRIISGNDVTTLSVVTPGDTGNVAEPGGTAAVWPLLLPGLCWET